MTITTKKQKEPKKPKNSTWQLQEAKAMFSEVIKDCAYTPQFITVHGKKTAVILSYGEYKKSMGPKETLYELFQNSPFRDVELELPPRHDPNYREIEL